MPADRWDGFAIGGQPWSRFLVIGPRSARPVGRAAAERTWLQADSRGQAVGDVGPGHLHERADSTGVQADTVRPREQEDASPLVVAPRSTAALPWLFDAVASPLAMP